MRLTVHGIERMGERLGVSAGANRLASRAFQRGLRRADVSGDLGRHLDNLCWGDRKADNPRIYGQFVYLFADDTLITVLPLPREYRRAAKKLADRRRKP